MSKKLTAAEAVTKLKTERAKIPAVDKSKIGSLLTGAKAEETKAALMADAVLGVLETFCNQSEKFAKAVIAGGSFAECMKKVAKGAGNYIDGVTACQKAVQFYAPQAKIQPLWGLLLPGEEEETESVAPQEIKAPDMIIDLSDFFG